MAIETTTVAAVSITAGGVAIEYFGVPSAALVGAGMGAVVALFLSPPLEPKSKMWLFLIASFAIGVYGGQLAVSYFPSISISVACAVCAALGIVLWPSIKSILVSKLGGQNGSST
ncbi:hypothetical protein UFOVP607_4 [uncultured Caudovirales phage]|uniref:Phage holin n=1 Tax=uncultured Caudovirales phage TaxID=2100421 RepID=A0A6J5N1S8_9CAUD|nr:hypothetical protein UFOVP607_4 [uncultured Caudovirales phage]